MFFERIALVGRTSASVEKQTEHKELFCADFLI